MNEDDNDNDCDYVSNDDDCDDNVADDYDDRMVLTMMMMIRTITFWELKVWTPIDFVAGASILKPNPAPLLCKGPSLGLLRGTIPKSPIL